MIRGTEDTDRIVNIVATRIRDLRRSRGETGTALAKALGVSPQQMTKIERGQCRASIVQLWQVAEHYGVPVETFLQNLLPGDQDTITPLRDRLTLELARAAKDAPPRLLEAVLRLLHSVAPSGDPSATARH
jgi:transcriptional regulator with XRE-family HTH domain